MANLKLRSTTSATDPGSTSAKGSALTFAETDSNFILINDEVATKTSLSGSTNNTITTVTGANAIQGEANLTFDGTTLGVANTSTDDSLLITTTEDSSTAGPVITLKRNSGSPANSDYLGQIKFKGENDADQEVVYAKITGKISDVADGTEDGLIEFALKKGGSNNIGARLTSTDLKLLNDTQLDIDSAPTFTENATPLQLSGTQPNAGGYFTHTTINNQTSRGGIGYRGNTNAFGSKVDTHMLFFDLDDDFGLRPTGAFQGDHNIWFQANHTNNVFDMFFDGMDLARIRAFGHGGNSYALKALELNGSTISLKGSNNLVADITTTGMQMSKPLDMNNQNITMGGGDIDLENGNILNSSGDINFTDNVQVSINSAGTNTITSVNSSNTGIGIRSTVGTSGNAHSSGTAFLARRGTASGFQELLKVESTGTGANEGVIVMSNIDSLTNQDTVTTGSGTFALQEYLEVVVNGNQRYIPLYSRS